MRLTDPHDETICQFNCEFSVITGLVNLCLLWNKIDKSPPPQEPVVQAADPEPTDSVLPADPEPADPEPVPSDILGPDDYDEVQVLTLVRMWSGFDSEMITDEQLLVSLELDDNYPDADIPDWVMTDLGVLATKGDVTVNEFVVALQYVLEYT